MRSDLDIVDRRFASFVPSNATLEELAGGFRWTEGPVWFGDWQTLLFSDIPNDRVMCWSERGGVTVFREPSGFENGHARDRQGRLVSCSHGGCCITRTEHDGRIVVLADRYRGKRLNSPNDVAVKSDGSIWFTDPVYGIRSDYEGGRAASELPTSVYRLDPGNGALDVVADDFHGPNGLCFAPDESRLYVAETGDGRGEVSARHIRVFDVSGDGTRLAGGRVFHRIDPGSADGFRCDEEGLLWSSAADGVHCIDPSGALIGKVLVPQRVANLAFGGRNRCRLFICASQSLYAIYTNRRGAQWP